MKKIIQVSLLSMLSISLAAQDLEATIEETHVSGISGTDGAVELTVYADIINVSENALEIECAREIIVKDADLATERFCFAGLCFVENTDVSPLTLQMAPGYAAEAIVTDENGLSSTGPGLTGYYNYNGQDGLCQIRYCFREVGNPSNSTCITANFCVASFGECDTFLGTNEIIEETILGQVSPNPASENFLVSYKLGSEAVNAEVIIMNALGEQVKSVRLSSRTGVINFDATELQTGMYFYTLKNNGKTEGTKKFIVSR